MMWRRWCARTVAASVLLSWVGIGSAGTPDTQPPVRIGLSGSLVQDVPAALLKVAMGPFQSLIENHTGVKGECIVVQPDQLTEQLVERKVDIAVFQGYEFAWARLKQPNLLPLMIAVNQQRYHTAHVVVPKEGGAANLAGLKQHSLAVPRGTKGYSLLFLERECQAGGECMQRHFAKIQTPVSAEDALDDVIDGAVDSALVDGLGLGSYERRKPGRFSQLKVIQKSPLFPAPVIACRPGSFDQAAQRRFQDGLLAASQNSQSRRVLQLWRLTGFETVPADYLQSLTDIARTYPPSR